LFRIAVSGDGFVNGERACDRSVADIPAFVCDAACLFEGGGSFFITEPLDALNSSIPELFPGAGL
jgi:hypothetical protein